MKNKGIKLNMSEYQIRKAAGMCEMTEQDKIARIYALAKQMSIKLGKTNEINNNHSIL